VTADAVLLGGDEWTTEARTASHWWVFSCWLMQLIWTPGDGVPMPLVFAPLVVGLLSLLASVVLGVARGTGLYRAAVCLGLLGLLTIVASLILPLDRGIAGPRPSPTNAQIVLVAGVALFVLSAVAGAVAIARDGARASGHRPGSAAT
jgi:hypothetical protein